MCRIEKLFLKFKVRTSYLLQHVFSYHLQLIPGSVLQTQDTSHKQGTETESLTPRFSLSAMFFRPLRGAAGISHTAFPVGTGHTSVTCSLAVGRLDCFKAADTWCMVSGDRCFHFLQKISQNLARLNIIN